MMTLDSGWLAMWLKKQRMNKLILIMLLVSGLRAKAQMLESESRPYRFSIDHSKEYSDESGRYSFKITPYRNYIRDRLEKEITKWFEEEGKQLYNDPTYDERLIQQIEKVKPIIIHDLGMDVIKNCKSTCYLISQTLEMEVQFTDFRPFRIGVPLVDMESFHNDFHKMIFENQRITFNDRDEFVFTYVEIYNPVNGKKYFFHNTADETINAPSFNIHIPESGN